MEGLKDRNPFKVPKGYFEGLPGRVMCSLPGSVAEERRSIPLLERMKPWMYMAAAFLGIVAMYGLFGNVGKSDGQSAGVNEARPSVYTVTAPAGDEDSEFFEYISAMYADNCIDYYMDDIAY